MESALQFVSASKVIEVLHYDELIETMKDALGKFSRPDSSVVQPIRTAVSIKEHNGWLGVMPGYSAEDNALATKLVTFFPCNKEVPTHHALIIVFDATTGIPRAIVDGEVITAMRTAAVSALASQLLARKNPKILAIIGTGVQARSNFYALSAVNRYTEVRVYSRSAAKVQKLAQEIGAVACSTAKEAVQDADVIVTVTSSSKPVLELAWVKDGVHINAVGACRPDWHEVEPALMEAATVYVDSRDAALKEAGDILLSNAGIYAEIGEVINKTKDAKTENITVFKSLGLAIEDVLSAKLVLDKLHG